MNRCDYGASLRLLMLVVRSAAGSAVASDLERLPQCLGFNAFGHWFHVVSLNRGFSIVFSGRGEQGKQC